MYRTYLLTLILFLGLLSGCNKDVEEPEANDEGKPAIEVDTTPKANKEDITIKLINQAEAVIGTATVTESDDGVAIYVEADHLPEGLHGFHIHERGLCEAPTFSSAGGHFNPTAKQHGFKNPQGFHAGDLKNLIVAADGTVKQTFHNKHVTLQPGFAHSLQRPEGSSLIIHADPDDYQSDPSGNSGERIACGVIFPGEKE